MVTGSKPSSTRHDVEAVLKPDPRRFAPRILGWIICWPWDMLCSLIANNPVQLIVIFLATEIRAALDEITQGEFKDIEQDLVIDEPLPASPLVEPVSIAITERLASPPVVEPSSAPPAGSIIAAQPVPALQLASAAMLGAAYPEDPWYAPRLPAGQDDESTRGPAVWTPPQMRIFGQPSQN